MVEFRLEPLAFFVTWTTYGSWLPGDSRGWTDARGMHRDPNARLARRAAVSLRGSPVVFDTRQRRVVERAIIDRCMYARWVLHAVQCRSNHVHAVVSAFGRNAGEVVGSLKAWCSRAIRAECPIGSLTMTGRIWTRGSSERLLFDDHSLAQAVVYVIECQDNFCER